MMQKRKDDIAFFFLFFFCKGQKLHTTTTCWSRPTPETLLILVLTQQGGQRGSVTFQDTGQIQGSEEQAS